MVEKGYLEYLQGCYREIYDYIRSMDNAVDHDKLSMFFDKTVSPYKYWLDEHKEPMKEENKIGLLDALKKKYALQPTRDGFKTTKYLGPEDFKKLADNMRKCGYEYENREFMRVVENE